MKTIAIMLFVCLAAGALSACGGSPMSVDSRTASSDRNADLTLEDKIRIHQRIVNSRGSY